MNTFTELEEKISLYVTQLYTEYQAEDLCYHNLEHTQSVVKRSLEIATNYAFNNSELFVLTAAAWFHDTGQLDGTHFLHEDRSVIIMKKFLEPIGIDKEIIDKIASCICATKLPQQPKSLMEEIICDADTYNLGTVDFLKTDELLKKEYQLKNIPVTNWEESCLNFLQGHKYFTTYCNSLLNRGKEYNIDLVRFYLQEKVHKNPTHTA